MAWNLIATAEQLRTLGEWVKTNAEVGSAAAVSIEMRDGQILYVNQGDAYAEIEPGGVPIEACKGSVWVNELALMSEEAAMCNRCPHTAHTGICDKPLARLSGERPRCACPGTGRS